LIEKPGADGMVQVGTNAGDSFSLFDGSISGTVEECSKDQKLVWKWRQSSWADGVFSTCNIVFTENGTGDSCI
jgi:activator of HSP90 ATPase